MTGGTTVVLGRTGPGMSGGVAFVFDADGSFEANCNPSMVALERVMSHEEQVRTSDPRTWHMGCTDEELLRRLITRHQLFTDSTLAAELLEHWSSTRARFVKVIPLQYRAVLQSRA